MTRRWRHYDIESNHAHINNNSLSPLPPRSLINKGAFTFPSAAALLIYHTWSLLGCDEEEILFNLNHKTRNISLKIALQSGHIALD